MLVKELYQTTVKTTPLPFYDCQRINNFSTFDWFTGLCGNHTPYTLYNPLDAYAKNIHGNKILFNAIETLSDYNALLEKMHFVLFTNSYKYGRLYATMIARYNPIENYDRTEDTTLTDTFDKTWTKGTTAVTTDVNDRTNTETKNLNDTLGSKTDVSTIVTGLQENDSEVKKQVTAYDSSTFNNANLETVHATSGQRTDRNTTETGAQINLESGTITNAITGGGSETTVNSGSDKDTGTITHVTHIHSSGNIGVTTSQEMLESERKIAEFNLVKIIVDDVLKQICWGVLEIG